MESDAKLVKASLARPETLETVPVLWNPARYRIHRRQRLRSTPVLGGGAPAAASHAFASAGVEEWFETELFVDSTDLDERDRDARRLLDRLRRWVGPDARTRQPIEVAFLWGPFRFRGAVERLEEEWIRFDPDGTPVRAWVTLVLRRG